MDLRITWSRLRDHFRYSRVIYIVAAFVVAITWNLLYSATKPGIPGDKQVVVVSSAYVLHESAMEWVEELKTVLPEDQELVDFYTLSYDGNPVGGELMFARLAAEEGDLWLVPFDIYSTFAAQGAWHPLDIPDESGQTLLDRLNIPSHVDPGAALTGTYVVGMPADATEPHIAGIPLDTMEGFFELGMNPVDMVLCIPVYTDNLENVLTAMNWMLDTKQVYEPQE